MEHNVQFRVENTTKCIFAIVGKFSDDTYQAYFFEEDMHQELPKDYVLSKTKRVNGVITKAVLDRLERRGYVNINVVKNLKQVSVLD